MFEKAGASIVDTQSALQSDLILKVRAPTSQEISSMKDEAGLISYIAPAQNPEIVENLKTKKITSFAMD